MRRLMDPDYVIMIVAVSLIMLVMLFIIFARDNWWKKPWHHITKPVTLREVFRDWIAYVLIFIALSLIVRGVLCQACSYCQPC